MRKRHRVDFLQTKPSIQSGASRQIQAFTVCIAKSQIPRNFGSENGPRCLPSGEMIQTPPWTRAVNVQNESFAPNWSCRGVPTMPVIRPNAGLGAPLLLKAPTEFVVKPRLVRLKALNISTCIRNFILSPFKPKSFLRLASVDQKEGPVSTFAPTFPR